jgi:hypothetical protein
MRCDAAKATCCDILYAESCLVERQSPRTIAARVTFAQHAGQSYLCSLHTFIFVTSTLKLESSFAYHDSAGATTSTATVP